MCTSFSKEVYGGEASRSFIKLCLNKTVALDATLLASTMDSFAQRYFACMHACTFIVYVPVIVYKISARASSRHAHIF